MSTILVALQFWHGDKDKAMETARLIADMQPQKDHRFDFLFSARYDTTHDQPTVEYVSRKFNVFRYTNSRRRGEGWPQGCNDLWFGTVDHVYDYGRAHKLPVYDAVLTLEADAYPLERHWLSVLSQEWGRLRPTGAKMVGALLQAPAEHVNGNCLVDGSPDNLKWLSRVIGGCSPAGGWDFVLREDFKKRGWADTKTIRSYWNAATAKPPFLDRLRSEGAVFLHGIKDSSVVDYVRANVLGQTS